MAEATSLNALKKALKGSDSTRASVTTPEHASFARAAVATPMADVYTRPENRSGELAAIETKKDQLTSFITSISGTLKKEIEAYNEVQEDKKIDEAFDLVDQDLKNNPELAKKFNKTVTGLNYKRGQLLKQRIALKEQATLSAAFTDAMVAAGADSSSDPTTYAETANTVMGNVISNHLKDRPILAGIGGYDLAVGEAMQGHVLSAVANFGTAFRAKRNKEIELDGSALVVDSLNVSPETNTYSLDIGKLVGKGSELIELNVPTLSIAEKTALAKNSGDVDAFVKTSEGINIVEKAYKYAEERKANGLPTSGYLTKSMIQHDRFQNLLNNNQLTSAQIFEGFKTYLDNHPEEVDRIERMFLEGDFTLNTGSLMKTSSFVTGFWETIHKARNKKYDELTKQNSGILAQINLVKREARSQAADLLAAGENPASIRDRLSTQISDWKGRTELSAGEIGLIVQEVAESSSTSILRTPTEMNQAVRITQSIALNDGADSAREFVLANFQNPKDATTLLNAIDKVAEQSPIEKTGMFKSFEENVGRLSNWNWGSEITSQNVTNRDLALKLKDEGLAGMEDFYYADQENNQRSKESWRIVNRYLKDTYKDNPEALSEYTSLFGQEDPSTSQFVRRNFEDLRPSEQRQVGRIFAEAYEYNDRQASRDEEIDSVQKPTTPEGTTTYHFKGGIKATVPNIPKD